MSALDIQPHSRNGSTLAVAFLSLLAVGAFVAGLNNQLIGGALPPSPTATASRAADAIPEATPAPDMQLAEAGPPAPHRPSRPSPAAADAAAPLDVPAPAAQAPPAVNAAAIAPDAAPAPAPTPTPTPTAPDNTPPIG